MGRKICVFMIGLILMGLAGEVRAQEHLDTLWTRTIGGAGNDVFYAMAKGNDGNVLIAARLDGAEGLSPGRYVLYFRPDGTCIDTVSINVAGAFTEITSLRETEEGEIELTFGSSIYRIGIDGRLLWSILIPGAYGDYTNGRRISSSSFFADTLYSVSGRSYYTILLPNYGWYHTEGNWLGRYDINSNGLLILCTYCDAMMTESNCHIEWESESTDDSYILTIRRYCIGNENPQITYSLSFPIGVGNISYLRDETSSLWVTSRNPFCIARPGYFLPMCFDGAASPSLLDYDFDGEGNLVVFGPNTVVNPTRGMRFDIIDQHNGIITKTSAVYALTSVEPKGMLLLEDNTAFTVSTVLNGTTRDLVIARTANIASEHFIPEQPTLELLVEGPPAWGYRVRTGQFSQSSINLSYVCMDAELGVSGSATGRWTSSRSGTDLVLNRSNSLAPFSTEDTLWLIADACLSSELQWRIYSNSDTIRGPLVPTQFVQTFNCRVESHGVRINWSMVVGENVDSVAVWRTSNGTGETRIGSFNCNPGFFTLMDDNPPVGRQATYYLVAHDFLGRDIMMPQWSQEVYIDPTLVIPDNYNVYPPYPNPFNASTTFAYDIPSSSSVSLRVYDITGRQVATLVDEFKEAGSYTVSFDAAHLASGLYVYAFDAWQFTHHGKILLLK